MGERIIDLHAARTVRRLDARAAAQRQLAGARQYLGLTHTAMAEALATCLPWAPTADAVRAWETTGVPPGDVIVAAGALAGDQVAPAASGLHLLRSYEDVQSALGDVVGGAERSLAITGSRSRDPLYLSAVETAVAARPQLEHWRVLYGPIRHSSLQVHLLRLADLHLPRVRVGIYRDLLRDGERFLCASERAAVVVLPSLQSLHNFDSGLLIEDPGVAAQYVEHVRMAYLGAEPLTDRAAIEHLEVQR